LIFRCIFISSIIAHGVSSCPSTVAFAIVSSVCMTRLSLGNVSIKTVSRNEYALTPAARVHNRTLTTVTSYSTATGILYGKTPYESATRAAPSRNRRQHRLLAYSRHSVAGLATRRLLHERN